MTLPPVERLRQVVVRAEPQALQLVVEFREPGQDQDRRRHPRRPQPPQDFVAVDVRKHQVKNDDVVIVDLPDLQAVLTELGRIEDESLGLEHQFDALGERCIIFDQQNAHDGRPPGERLESRTNLNGSTGGKPSSVTFRRSASAVDASMEVAALYWQDRSVTNFVGPRP
jgi:hypothetical protein